MSDYFPQKKAERATRARPAVLKGFDQVINFLGGTSRCTRLEPPSSIRQSRLPRSSPKVGCPSESLKCGELGAHRETALPNQTSPASRRADASILVGYGCGARATIANVPLQTPHMLRRASASTAGHFPRMWLTVKGHFSASSLHHILCGTSTCGIRSATFRARPSRARAFSREVQTALGHYLVVAARRSMK
jgi:hypothetical protein